jgi:hypothetical protein
MSANEQEEKEAGMSWPLDPKTTAELLHVLHHASPDQLTRTELKHRGHFGKL